MEDNRRCKAHLTDGSGRRCMKAAIRGGTVCGSHGGRAPQVKKSARERLNALVEPAIEALSKALRSGDVNAIIRASVAVLDRCGFHPSQVVELTGKDGRPIQTQEVSWIEHCTLEEKRTILEIAEHAAARSQQSPASSALKVIE